MPTNRCIIFVVIYALQQSTSARVDSGQSPRASHLRHILLRHGACTNINTRCASCFDINHASPPAGLSGKSRRSMRASQHPFAALLLSGPPISEGCAPHRTRDYSSRAFPTTRRHWPPCEIMQARVRAQGEPRNSSASRSLLREDSRCEEKCVAVWCVARPGVGINILKKSV